MRGKTIADELVAGTLVIVHADSQPNPREWTEHCAAIAERRAAIRGVLVIANGPGPNAGQRAELHQSWGGATPPPVAVMTRSMLIRGVLTALNWFMANRLKGFSDTDFDAALAYIKVTPSAVPEIMRAMRQLAANLGVAIAEPLARAAP